VSEPQSDSIEIDVRRPDGWTTVTFPSDCDIEVAGGQVDGELSLTLIGKQEDQHHVIKTGVLDVDPADEEYLENPVPRTADGTSTVLERLISN